MDSQQAPQKRVSGKAVVFGLGIVSAVLGFGLLGWMLTFEPDTVDYDQAGPTQSDRIFPPPVADED